VPDIDAVITSIRARQLTFGKVAGQLAEPAAAVEKESF
jgi:hypothetical protein